MKITNYHLHGPKLKIAILADIHNYPIPQAIEFLKNHKPDIICVPGDIASGHLTGAAWQNDTRAENKKNPYQEPTNALKILKELPQIAPTFII